MVSVMRRDEAGLTRQDRDGFAAFYDATLPAIYGYFLRRCGGLASVAEDLTQETYLAAARELKRRRPVDAPLPWLYGIARHKLLDHYRQQGRERGAIVPWHDRFEQNIVLPDVDPVAVETNQRLIAALARLPDGQRAAIVLRYLDGHSVPAVAAALGKSVHAAESLLVRGRANLKRVLMEPEQEVGHG